MAHIEWGEKYAVHVKILDEQHQETVRLFNLMDDIAAGQGSVADLATVIEQAVAHLHNHIATEERYFDEWSYEHAVEHKAAHRAFLLGVEQVLSVYREDSEKIIKNVLPLMAAWLEVHTAVHDKKYTDYFHAHGMDGTAAQEA